MGGTDLKKHGLFSVFGHLFFYWYSMAVSCVRCGMNAAFVCGKCQKERYCSRMCQKLAWPSHRPFCTGSQKRPKKAVHQQNPRDILTTAPTTASATGVSIFPPPGSRGLHYIADPAADVVSAATINSILLVLHGIGDTEQDAIMFARSMNISNMGIVSARGPLKMPQQLPGHTWYSTFDKTGTYLPANGRVTTRRDSIEAVARPYLHRLFRRLTKSLPHAHLFVLGFGQGGLVAVDAALSFEGKQLSGVVTVNGGLYLEEMKAEQLVIRRPDTPIMAIHSDDVINILLPAVQHQYGCLTMKRSCTDIQLVVQPPTGISDNVLSPASLNRVYRFIDRNRQQQKIVQQPPPPTQTPLDLLSTLAPTISPEFLY